MCSSRVRYVAPNVHRHVWLRERPVVCRCDLGRFEDAADLLDQPIAANPGFGDVDHPFLQIRKQRSVSLADSPQMGAAGRVLVRQRVEIERQVHDKDDERERRKDSPGDDEHAALPERRGHRRAAHAHHQQRFAASEQATPSRFRLGDGSVGFLALGNLAERQPEMIEQRET